MRRKILMGVLALALPAGTMAVTSSSAFAASDNPISCTAFAGTVTFGTPLSTPGVATSAKTGLPTTVSGTSGTCGTHALTVTGGLAIAGGKNTKLAKTDPRYNKSTGVKYLTGTWASFAAAGGSLKKTLKVINFSIGGAATQFKTKSAGIVVGGACGSAVGFDILGQVKSGTYVNKHSGAHVLACLVGDSGGTSTNNFGADYSNAQGVVSATIGGSSAAIL